MTTQLVRLLDDAQQREICAVVAGGGGRKQAAAIAGCSETSIRYTARNDASFAADLARAETQHELGYLQRIRIATNKESNWRAATWILERLYPDRYQKRKPDQITATELAQAMSALAEVILDEVDDPLERRRIERRLRELSHNSQRVGRRRRASR